MLRAHCLSMTQLLKYALALQLLPELRLRLADTAQVSPIQPELPNCPCE